MVEERSGFEGSFLSSEGMAPAKSNDALGRTGHVLFELARSLKVSVAHSNLRIEASGTSERTKTSGMPGRSRASGTAGSGVGAVGMPRDAGAVRGPEHEALTVSEE